MIYRELFEFVVELNTTEKELINRSINNNSSIQTNEIKLFKFLCSQVTLPKLKEVTKAVYNKAGTPSYDSFKKLIYRVKSKVFEAVTIDNYSYSSFENQSSDTINEIDKIKRNILRKALVIQSFLEKRNSNFIKQLLDDIIHQSSKYELFYLTVEYLQIKLSLICPVDGETEFSKIASQIAFYEACRDSVNKAHESYIKFTVFNDPCQNFLETEQDVLGNIKVLHGNLSRFNSNIVRYYLLFYEMNLDLLRGNFVAVKEKSTELIQFILEKNISLPKEKLWTVKLLFIKSQIHLKNFEQALILLHQSHADIKIGSRPFLICSEYEFLCNMYLKRYNRAEIVLNLIFEDTRHYNSFEREKLFIYKANLNFIKGQYKDVYDILYVRRESLKDITGWEYSRRILQLFINMHRGKEDEVIRDFECLKKQVKRNGAIKREYRFRDVIIFKIMGHICKKDYILNREDIKLKNLIRSLKDFPWQSFSCELIPVEEIIEDLFLKSEGNLVAV